MMNFDFFELLPGRKRKHDWRLVQLKILEALERIPGARAIVVEALLALEAEDEGGS